MLQPPGARLLQARLDRNLSDLEVASALGLPLACYRDLESKDQDLFSNISLEQLLDLCHLVDLSPIYLYLGTESRRPLQTTSLGSLTWALKCRTDELGTTRAAFGDGAGKAVAEVLANPMKIWTFTIDRLREVCGAVGLEWTAIIAGLSERSDRPWGTS